MTQNEETAQMLEPSGRHRTKYCEAQCIAVDPFHILSRIVTVGKPEGGESH